MSGTSMDSLDAALVDFSDEFPQIICTDSTPVSQTLKNRLLQLCVSPHYPDLGEMDNELGIRFSDLALKLINKANMKPEDVCVIGSHGQTIFHQPPQSASQPGFSVQLGNPNIIAERTGISVVADFRRKDMAAGGQGAPLVPAFHRAVFSSSKKNRVIVNIGGIANISVLSASGKVIGFDTGPGNVLLDAWVQKNLNKSYDEAGRWASQGKVNPSLLSAFLQEDFLKKAPPKSTGRELFNLNWLEKLLSMQAASISAVDIQATLTSLTATSISNAVKNYAPDTNEIFICGGGAHNNFLLELLQKYSSLEIRDTSALGIDPDWVEATAFAWLAKQTIERKTGNLPEVTGATKTVVLGGIYFP